MTTLMTLLMYPLMTKLLNSLTEPMLKKNPGKQVFKFKNGIEINFVILLPSTIFQSTFSKTIRNA